MTQAFSQILAQLDILTPEERAELAYLCLQSLEPKEDGVEQAWDEELARRVARIQSGQAVGKPAEEVFADWRQSG